MAYFIDGPATVLQEQGYNCAYLGHDQYRASVAVANPMILLEPVTGIHGFRDNLTHICAKGHRLGHKSSMADDFHFGMKKTLEQNCTLDELPFVQYQFTVDMAKDPGNGAAFVTDMTVSNVAKIDKIAMTYGGFGRNVSAGNVLDDPALDVMHDFVARGMGNHRLLSRYDNMLSSTHARISPTERAGHFLSYTMGHMLCAGLAAYGESQHVALLKNARGQIPVTAPLRKIEALANQNNLASHADGGHAALGAKEMAKLGAAIAEMGLTYGTGAKNSPLTNHDAPRNNGRSRYTGYLLGT